MKTSSVHLIVAFVLLAAGFSVCQAARTATSKADHTRTLTGHVFGRNGQRLLKAVVYLKNTKTLVVKTYISDADGSYRFPDLSSAIDYEVYAEYNGARSDTNTVSAFDKRKVVNITLRVN